MKRLFLLMLVWMYCGFIHAQLSECKIQKAKFVKPTVGNLILLYENLDEDKWREMMKPFGYVEQGLDTRLAALHYTKGNSKTYYSVVSFDDQYGVVTISWLDPSGEYSMMKDLRKELKNKLIKETAINKTYQVKGKNNYWVTLTVQQFEQKIFEEVSIELAR